MNTTIHDTVARQLREQLAGATLQSLQKLHGDASYRSYYRATLDDGRTLIVMQLPQGISSASEEITNFSGKMSELPFINVQRFLAEHEVPVPEVLAYNPETRLMILNDLGSMHLYDCVAQASNAEQLSWYTKAIHLLVQLQQAADSADRDTCVALQRSFDEDLLNWEFNHFLEYGWQARGVAVSDVDRSHFLKHTRAITREISTLPFGFTHRDFQSRNIMVYDGTLFLIDFQDALLGPQAYDLVALLRDSYITLPHENIEHLLNLYAELRGVDGAALHKQFHLITVQRKLKDAGRFVYIDRVKGNPNYLQHIPASLRSVCDALESMPEHEALLALLRRLTPELAA